jgi:Co/Zn/Cd efflux system component
MIFSLTLALQLSHFTAAALFAFFFSVIFGITQRNTPNEMVRYGAYCFTVAMIGMFVAGWVMWLLHH